MTTETILPEAAAPMLADVDWPRFRAEAEALASELQAQYPHLTAREAGECAAAEVQRRYEAELAAPVCELCGELAELVGEQWTCPGCAPSAAPTLPTVRRAGCGAFLVKSRTRNLVHVVSADGSRCSCEARPGTCWHLDEVAKLITPAPLTFDASRVLANVRSARAA